MSKKLWAPMMACSVLALASVTVSGGQAPQMPTPKVSQANRVNFKEAQDALAAKRYSEVVAKANAVLGSSNRTKDDTFAAHSMLLQAAQGQGDSAGMMKAMEGQIDSGFLPASLVNLQYRNLLGLAYQQKDYKKVIEYGQQLIKAGDNSAEVYQWVGQSYYELKDFNAAVKFFNDIITDKEKRGQKPGRNELILLRSAYDKAGKKDQAQATLEKVVKYYPDSGTWLALLYDVKREKLDLRQKLHLYRLMDVTGNLKQGPDFMAYSDAAISAGLLAESQKVLEAGIKANVWTEKAEKDRALRYIKSAATNAELTRAQLPKLESEAKAAPNGEKYVALGMIRYSFGQYDEAIAALQAGLAKGNLKNAADAQMSLGVAQLKAGHKAEALKSFRAAKFTDEVSQRIVELWALYAS